MLDFRSAKPDPNFPVVDPVVDFLVWVAGQHGSNLAAQFYFDVLENPLLAMQKLTFKATGDIVIFPAMARDNDRLQVSIYDGRYRTLIDTLFPVEGNENGYQDRRSALETAILDKEPGFEALIDNLINQFPQPQTIKL